MVLDFLEEEEVVEVEEGRSTDRTKPLYPSTSPRGEDWATYFKRLNARVAPEGDSEEEPVTLLETGLPLGELTTTQKRVWSEAEKAGFRLEGYGSRVHFADKIQKEDGKTALAGDVTRAAYDATNVFIGGYVPNSALRFHASWLEPSFRAFIWDPIGRYMYANSQSEDERETFWVFRGSQEFEAWLNEWRLMLTGSNRALEKQQAAEAALARKRAKQEAIYKDYLEHQGVAWVDD